MKNFNDLPIELYSTIFKYLTIKDLFNCRLVSKKIYFETFKCVPRLTIDKLDQYFYDLNKYYWHFKNELINEDNVIEYKYFQRIESISIFNLHNYLKYLKISFYESDTKFNLKDQFLNLNQFINLEYLDVFTYRIVKSNLYLNLKNLKYFIDSSIDLDYLELDTPKLKKFKTANITKIHMKSNPKSISHLITFYFEDQLKQFKITNRNETNFYREEICNLIGLLNNRTKLNRDIDIYIGGVKTMNVQKFKEFNSFRSVIEYQIKNYDLLDLNLPEINHLYYPDLLNSINDLKNDLPLSFFDKYQNTNVFILKNRDNKSIDNDHLIWFLNNLKYLKKLVISNVSLKQNFYDNLPNTIRFLYIDSINGSSKFLNFDFILKLTKLIRFFQFGFNIDLFDLALKSFFNLKYLEKFDFKFKDKNIEIYKEDKNYDQILKLCNKLRSELN